MEKRAGSLNEKNNPSYLSGLVRVLEEAVVKLEKDFRNGNAEEFSNSKKLVLEARKKIAGVLK